MFDESLCVYPDAAAPEKPLLFWAFVRVTYYVDNDLHRILLGYVLLGRGYIFLLWQNIYGQMPVSKGYNNLTFVKCF